MSFTTKLRLTNIGQRLCPGVFSNPVALKFNNVILAKNFTTSPMVMAMPIKRKKKLDPSILKAREEKRKKKLEKALTKMQKKPRINRPLLEIEPAVELVREANTRRKRDEFVLSEDETDRRALLLKEWSRFSKKRHVHEIMQIDTVILCQKKALEELRHENESLYFQAIKIDTTLIPFKCDGPTRTPPIPNYIQDGGYADVTKQYAVQYADMKSFLTELLRSNKHRRKKKEEEEVEDD